MAKKVSKRYKLDTDDQFDAFMKESVSSEDSSLDTARINRHLGSKKKEKPWWANEDDSIGEDVGLMGTGKSFLKKSVNKSANSAVTGRESAVSCDSLDDTSLVDHRVEFRNPAESLVPALSLGSTQSCTETVNNYHGKETLDEIAEKERFFKSLEKESDSTIDYSQLNRDLDQSETATMAPTIRAFRPPFSYQTGAELESSSEIAVAVGTSSEDKRSKESMLAKVALLDSLDSTLGTKPAASRDTLNDDMNTIPETNREYEDLSPKEMKTNFDAYDGHFVEGKIDKEEKDEDEEEEEMVSAENKGTDTVTTKALTLKTGTGVFGCTDTSREMEEYQQALRRVGMATLDDSTRDFTLKDSASAMIGGGPGSTQKTQDTEQGTGTFGLRPMGPKTVEDKIAKDVDSLIREVDELKRVKGENEPAVRFDDRVQTQNIGDWESLQGTGTQGFDLSPVHTTNDESYDLSPLDKYTDGSHPDLAQWQSRDEAAMSPPVPARRGKKNTLPESTDDRQSRARETKRKDPYAKIRSSGYGKKIPETKSPHRRSIERSPSPQKTSTPNNRSSKPRSRSNSNQRTSPSRNSTKATSASPHRTKSKTASGVFADPAMLASVQSFTSYIQQNFSQDGFDISGINGHRPQVSREEPVLSSSQKGALFDREQQLVGEVRDWQEQWKDERKMRAKLQAELAAQEREGKAKYVEHQKENLEEISKLKQENFVLSAKVNQKSTLRKGITVAKKPETKYDSDDSDREIKQNLDKAAEQIAKLEQEIREQDALLVGYQQENERLYGEKKKIQANNKEGEHSMFKANQRLNMELNQLRDSLDQKEKELKGREMPFPTQTQNGPGAVLGAGKIAQLQVELKQSKAKEESCREQLDLLVQTNKELENHIETLVTKLEACEETLALSNSKRVKEMQDKYQKEVDRLNRKLKWFSENQELLDKDKASLMAKDKEIKELKVRLERNQSQEGKKHAEARAKAKERSTDAKRILDLERQVKEMENIIKKRHPNSLPVLMWAANTAPSSTEATARKPPSMHFLENQIKSLEAELESKDEDSKCSLRVMEQKYSSMKFQYEERIQSLEAQVQQSSQHKEGERPHTHAGALQRELDIVRERNRKRIFDLELTCEGLRKELTAIKNKENSSAKLAVKQTKEAESELQLRMKALQAELCQQLKDKQQLQDQLNQAQKLSQEGSERNEKSRSRPGSGKSRGRTNPAGGKKTLTPSEPEATALPTFPALKEKQYEPTTFAGQHISDIVRENEDLKAKVEHMQLDMDSQHIQLQKLAAEVEAKERNIREEADDRIQTLLAAHQKELQSICVDHAMQHSTSKIVELQSKVETQEVMLERLKEQARTTEVEREQLSASKQRNSTLETEIVQVKDDLVEARRCHAPEMRHYQALKCKIQDMEARHSQRERDLQQIIKNSHQAASLELSEEGDRWKKVIEVKNRETEKFRAELDAILNVLRELQRQGVVIPYKPSFNSYQ